MIETSQEIKNMIEENKKFYPYYNQAHLERNLKFCEERKDVLSALATFPRSGSSLLMNIIENISGYFMGEDMPIEGAEEAIRKGNVRGTVDFVKEFRTHFPYNPKFPWRTDLSISCNKAVVLIRNPFRSFVSLFSMIVVNRHAESLPKEEYIRRKEDFNTFLVATSKNFNRFCEFWTNQEIPVLFVRYEDLFENSVETVKKIFSFYEGNDVSGTNIESNIIEYFRKNGLKSTFNSKQKSMGDQYSYYSEEQIKLIYEDNKKWLKFFNYMDDFNEVKENFNFRFVTEEADTN